MNCPACHTVQEEGAKFCSACGTSLAGPPPVKTEGLPSAALRPRAPMSPGLKLLYAGGALILAAVFLWLFLSYLPGGEHPVIAQQPDVAMSTMYMGKTIPQEQIQVEIRDGVVRFPLTEVLEKKIVAFDYRMPTRTVPLLAYVSTDGKLVTAIRMCEPCNSTSFRIEGGEMVCGQCGTRWKLSNLEGVDGSCQKYPPDPIPSTVSGNVVQIQESVIQQWKMRI